MTRIIGRNVATRGTKIARRMASWVPSVITSQRREAIVLTSIASFILSMIFSIW